MRVPFAFTCVCYVSGTKQRPLCVCVCVCVFCLRPLTPFKKATLKCYSALLCSSSLSELQRYLTSVRSQFQVTFAHVLHVSNMPAYTYVRKDIQTYTQIQEFACMHPSRHVDKTHALTDMHTTHRLQPFPFEFGRHVLLRVAPTHIFVSLLTACLLLLLLQASSEKGDEDKIGRAHV